MRGVAITVAMLALIGTTGCRLARDTSQASTSAEDEAGSRPIIPAPTGTHVVMLGTGTPNPDPTRSGPAVAVIAGGKVYLVDAGPGVVRRAAAARQNGESSFTAPALDIVFITHLHTDHTVGLADLMFTPWVLEREAPLRVFGPPGTTLMADHIHSAYSEDIRIRLDGYEPANTTGHQVAARDVQAGLVYEDENVRVIAFEVPHGTWEHAFAYRFEAADRTIVISGDTGPGDEIVQACGGCDLLVHEVYSTEGFRGRSPIWQRYHSSFHTSTAELADIATRAGARSLVLYHQLYWGATDDDLVAEIRAAGWTGPIESARDLGVY